MNMVSEEVTEAVSMILFLFLCFCLAMALLYGEISLRTGMVAFVALLFALSLYLEESKRKRSSKENMPQSDKKVTPQQSGAQVDATPLKASDVLAICPKCKARVPSNSKFCTECGEDLRPKTDTPS